MFKILDLIYIKTVEKSYGFKFSRSQLEEAKFNEGHISVRFEGRFYYFRIPIVTLNDLIQDSSLANNQNTVSPWD